MSNSRTNPPASDEIEVSLFGPGYGEAIAIHIGDGMWILVDSCIDPESDQPASLQYLRELSIDATTAVQLIVATHWHDDHIRGLSEVFSACKSAEFAISSALRANEFQQLAALYQQYPMMKSSGLSEFVRILQILERRKQQRVRFNPPKFASMDRSLYQAQITLASEVANATLFALSPSDAAVLHAALAFDDLLPDEAESKKRIASPAPNHTSVVLWLEVGQHKILLGADLETSSDPKTGWTVILDGSTIVSGQAGVFKIPHHGSKNAHHDRVWFELLSPDPFAAVTSFRRGSTLLPSSKDVDRINSWTPNAYATTPARRWRQRWQHNVVRDLIDQTTQSIRNVHKGWGHVRFRRNINSEDESWDVQLYGDAYPLRA